MIIKECFWGTIGGNHLSEEGDPITGSQLGHETPQMKSSGFTKGSDLPSNTALEQRNPLSREDYRQLCKLYVLIAIREVHCRGLAKAQSNSPSFDPRVF